VPALLEGRDLWASYGSVRALQGVSLAVPDGALAAVVGPNGAGKSTLLRVLAGLHRPDAGRVTFAGVDLTGVPAHALARLGVALVPEGRGTFPGLTVAENLRLAGGDRRVAVRAFPVLGDRLGQVAGTLSGGEQQMLAMARCVSTGARVILLDEPSLALAPRLVSQVFDAVAALRAEGRTVVLVEQYVSRALEMADLVYVLQKGRCVFAGEPGELEHHRVIEGAYLGGAA
jgi:branched-chain amino acid transport system ATP-binding protein